MVLTFIQGRAVRFICRFLHPHKMSSAILRKDFSMDIQLGRLDGTLQIVYIWLSLGKLVDTNEDLSQIDCSSRNFPPDPNSLPLVSEIELACGLQH